MKIIKKHAEMNLNNIKQNIDKDTPNIYKRLNL